ncbi:MAG: metallophosphoesterase family protein [Lacipirellulaceae bacterium]
MARLIAIGDVHGCSAALATLVEAIGPTADDVVVPLGDYVDRGPDSRGVIQQLVELRERCTLRPILGNHEEMMLSALRGQAPYRWWLSHGGTATLDSYGFVGDWKCIPNEHVEFLDGCLDYFALDDWFFTHGGYVASEPLDQQPAEALRWLSLDQQLPEPHVSGMTAVVGHTAQRSHEVLDHGYLKCIDTHGYGGGWLTALDVRSGQVWQASARGRLRTE